MDARALDASLLGGIAWIGAAKWGSQILRWAATLVVARLLTPGDYGLVGMAAVYLGLVTLLSEFGLGAALVALRSLSAPSIAQLNTLSVLSGVGAFGVSIALAVPLGRFFSVPQLPAVITVLAAGLVVGAFKTVPLALLQRDLRFKTLALVEAVQASLVAASLVVLALLGFGYWTLVLGELVSAALTTGAVLLLRPHRFAWPRPRVLGPALAFSAHLFGSRLAWYVTSNADFAIAGRLLGSAALGAYSLAWTIAELPLQKISALVAQVTPAVFSVVQEDRAALRRYVLRITEGLALLTWPASIGIALVAGDLVLAVLGDKWAAAVGPLRLLALSVALRSTLPLIPQVLFVIGESRRGLRYGLLMAPIMATSFYVLGRSWGATGIAFAWLAIYPFVTAPALIRVMRQIGLSLSDYARALWPALSGCLLMSVGVLALHVGLGLSWSAELRLSIKVGTGVGIYLVTCLALHRQRMAGFFELVRAARGTDGAPVPSSHPPWGNQLVRDSAPPEGAR